MHCSVLGSVFVHVNKGFFCVGIQKDTLGCYFQRTKEHTHKHTQVKNLWLEESPAIKKRCHFVLAFLEQSTIGIIGFLFLNKLMID